MLPLYSNNDTVTTNRPAVLNDAYYLEDEDVSDEEDDSVLVMDGSASNFGAIYLPNVNHVGIL